MPEPRRLSRLLRFLPVLALAAPLAACTYGNGSGHHDHYYGGGSSDISPSCGAVEEAIIDADQQLEVDAGIGAGVFVEYDSGGTYHFTTSCDAQDGADCYWDILVTPLDGATVGSVSGFDLESDDELKLVDDSVNLVAYTGTDFDGFDLTTEPGAAVELDALLDGACGNRFMFWVGDGALRSGAPSNPIDLIPSDE